MKVLYILNSTIMSGGATKSFLTLITGLKDVHPYVIVPDRKGVYPVLKEKRIPTFVLSYRHCTYPRYKSVKDLALFFPRLIARRVLSQLAAKAVEKICTSEGIDLIHTNVSVIDIGIRAAQSLNIPHIFHIREFGDLDFAEHYFPCKRLYHKYFKKDKSYAICITKGIQKYHGLSDYNSTVIYNGISIKPLSDYVRTDERYFLFAGRIERAKGVKELLCAFKCYASQNSNPCKLLLAGKTGDTAYVNEIRLFIERNGLSSLVKLLGERMDIAGLMHYAMATIVPSKSEAFGRTTAEAMAYGCLVIGHDTGGTKEQFDNGLYETGHEIGIRYSTEEDLCKAMTKIGLSGSQDYAMMKADAKMTVQKLYNAENYVGKVCDYYNEILKQCHTL